jgi:hypothetical protein
MDEEQEPPRIHAGEVSESATLPFVAGLSQSSYV